MALFSNLGRYRDSGLLLVRVGIGLAFLGLHGYPKVIGGPKVWEAVGKSMSHVGVDFYPTFWGFMAGTTEALGGLFLMLGLFFRPTSLLLAFVMLIAMINHLAAGDGMGVASRPLEMMIVFLGLMIIGPGKYSVDRK